MSKVSRLGEAVKEPANGPSTVYGVSSTYVATELLIDWTPVVIPRITSWLPSAPSWINVNPGTLPTKSSSRYDFDCASRSPFKAVRDMGTSWRRSGRFCAVTTISSSWTTDLTSTVGSVVEPSDFPALESLRIPYVFLFTGYAINPDPFKSLLSASAGSNFPLIATDIFPSMSSAGMATWIPVWRANSRNAAPKGWGGNSTATGSASANELNDKMETLRIATRAK